MDTPAWTCSCLTRKIMVEKKKDRITTIAPWSNFSRRGSVCVLLVSKMLDLQKVLEWNVEHGIHFFRLSSTSSMSVEYQLSNARHDAILRHVRRQVTCPRTGHTYFHPGPFNKLLSKRESVSEYFEDTDSWQVFDMLGLPRNRRKDQYSRRCSIRKQARCTRYFCKELWAYRIYHFSLTVENDDRESLYSTLELFEESILVLGFRLCLIIIITGFVLVVLVKKMPWRLRSRRGVTSAVVTIRVKSRRKERL